MNVCSFSIEHTCVTAEYIISYLYHCQACEGSVAQLRRFLMEMNRPDAVNIIDHALAKREAEKTQRPSGEGSSGSQTRSKHRVVCFGFELRL